jgi:putative methyltransferase (TIGR04325 family)
LQINSKVNHAPVIIFAFNRPDHTQKCIDALMLNDGWSQTDVFIYCDGPRNEFDLNVEKTRVIAGNVKGCRSLSVIKSEKNKGLYHSVIEGVTEVIDKFNRAIIVEDDLITSPGFLSFMNGALEKYEDNRNVACISGYVYPLKKKFDQPFFIKGADCWGWATWKDRWNDLQTDASTLLSKIESNKTLMDEFTFNNSYPYLQMLRDRSAGLNQSWAILWYASSYLDGKLCLYPSTSLVKNIGNDGSGTHTYVPTKNFNTKIIFNGQLKLPDEIEENKEGRKSFETFFHSLLKPSNAISRIKMLIPGKVKSTLKKIVRSSYKSPWSGDYSGWPEAKDDSTGYDSSLILEKVKKSVLKVKNGEAVYERDSVLFDQIEYSGDILELFKAVLNEKHSLNIVDFGGSLGSSYFQYSKLLNSNKKIHWSVVEQNHFVDAGKKEIEDSSLKFFHTVDEALMFSKNEILLLSSVLPYLEKPYEILNELLKKDFRYVVVDRTPFIQRKNDRLTVQVVPKEIYLASYPAWFFNEEKFKNQFKNNYMLLREFECKTDPKEYLGKDFTYRKGFIFKRNDEA